MNTHKVDLARPVVTARDSDATQGRERPAASHRGVVAARWSCTERTALEPSPTAAATRFMEPWRTSPTANTPGTLVSKGKRGRLVVYASGGRSRPVSTKP